MTQSSEEAPGLGAATPAYEPYRPGVDTVDDLRDRARKVLSPNLFAHVVGGAGDERTTAANQAGYGRFRLIPRVLIDTLEVDTSIEILGTKLVAPIFVCPTGGIHAMHPDGERGVARAAANAGVLFVLAGFPGCTTEEAAAAAGPARWHQLYWQGNREIMADLVQRAEDSKFRAIVLTVDSPQVVKKDRRRALQAGYEDQLELTVTPNLRKYMTPAWEGQFTIGDQGRIAAEASDDLTLTWKNMRWLRSIVHVPFGLKGIMSPHDALQAIEIGADAIIVSNHGGRQLDGEPGSIEVLEEIVKVVKGRIPVLVDGGVRRASDIAIALGLGAAAVGIGRPVVWALANGGEASVTAYLEDLVDDLLQTFRLLGVTTVKGLTRDRVSEYGRFVSDSELARYLPPL